MFTKIVVLDTPFDDNAPKFEQIDDNTTIERLFTKVVIIRTNSEDVADWIETSGFNVTNDNIVSLQLHPNDPLYDRKWEHYNNKGWFDNKTHLYWDSFSGFVPNKGICIIDTGIASHPDIDPNRLFFTVNGQYCCGISVKGNGTVTYHTSLDDDTQYVHPHGTHVAGIACAVGNNSVGVPGVIWNCGVFSINVFEIIPLFGVGAYYSSILKALEIFGNIDGLRTANMSLGGSYLHSFYLALMNAYETLRQKGKLVVVAAGNSSVDIAIYKFLPASAMHTISFTIGCSDRRGLKSWFSNYNYAMVDTLIAGGTFIEGIAERRFTEEDILAPLPQTEKSNTYSIIEHNGAKYGYMAGTSMASPFACAIIHQLYEIVNSLNPNATHDEKCNIVRTILQGSSYCHNADNYDASVTGGIADLSLCIRGVFGVWLDIREVYYEIDTGRLRIKIYNRTNSSRTYFISFGNATFVSPLEIQNNNRLIRYVTGNINSRAELTVYVPFPDYYDYQRIGILVCCIDSNNNPISIYTRHRINNILECPMRPINPITGLPCENVTIRCSDEDFLPIPFTGWHPLEASLVSELAYRVQQRLIFMYNSVKTGGVYRGFVPVATNGLCLNTTNYPNNSVQFPVRDDATMNDLVYALYSMYVQMRDIFERGAIIKIGDQFIIWYVFDYNKWRQSGKSVYQRIQLPDEYKLDESCCRFDKVGQIIRALNFMIYYSKIVFTVSYQLLYSSYYSYLYGAIFANELDNLSDDVYFYRTYLGDVSGSQRPPEYIWYDGQGNPYIRANWDSNISFPNSVWSHPFCGGLPNMQHWDYNIVSGNVIEKLQDMNPNKYKFNARDIFAVLYSILWKKSYTLNVGGLYCGNGSGGYVELGNSLAYLPLELKLPPTSQETEIENYGPFTIPNQPFVSVGAGYSDFIPNNNDAHVVFIEKSGKLYRGCRSLVGYRYFVMGSQTKYPINCSTSRLATGGGIYVMHNLVCSQVKCPVSLDIVVYSNVSTQYSIANKATHNSGYVKNRPESDKNFKKHEPFPQRHFTTYYVEIYKINLITNASELVYYNHFYVSNDIEGRIVVDKVICDIDNTEALRIKVRPTNDFKLNPTHTLIIGAYTDEDIFEIPVCDYSLIVDNTNSQRWVNVGLIEQEKAYVNDIWAFGVYSRGVYSGISVENTYHRKYRWYYPDIRGLPIDDYFNDIISYLGVQLSFDYKELDCCGWSKKRTFDYGGDVVVDQTPPFRIPFGYTESGQDLPRNMLICKAQVRGNEAAPIVYMPKDAEIEFVPNFGLPFSLPLLSKYDTFYFIPNLHLNYRGQKRYALRCPDNIRNNFDFIGFSKTMVSNLIDTNLVSFNFCNHYYHKDADGDTIFYQMPKVYQSPAPAYPYTYRYFLFVPESNNLRDYEKIEIPDLRLLNATEFLAIRDWLLQYFDIGYTYIKSSVSIGCIADQFPPPGIWFCRKGVDKPLIALGFSAPTLPFVSKTLIDGF